jgi:hypothetical protein
MVSLKAPVGKATVIHLAHYSQEKAVLVKEIIEKNGR